MTFENLSGNDRLEAIREYAEERIRLFKISRKGWRFDFDNAKSRLGQCDYGRKLITLSKHFSLHLSEKEIKNTVNHEIAHALAPGDGHGNLWKRKCIITGADPRRCADSIIFSSRAYKYYLVNPETKEILHATHRKTWWFNNPWMAYPKKRIDLKGTLKALTIDEAIAEGYI